MKLRTLRETDVYKKTILYRSSYDIGVKQTDDGKYEVKDNSRIKASLETVRYLLKNKCRIVILTYVKRPDGKVVEELRTTPHAKALSDLLGKPVKKADDCVGENVRKMVADLKEGEILMLENTRFHPEEMLDDDKFAKELAKNGEMVVYDGFPQAHRAHASTTGILRHLPSCAGFYVEAEVKALSQLLQSPKKPFTIIVGGAKISDKVDAINNLYDIADIILVGGGVANVFMKAEGLEVGDSFVEDVFVDEVRRKKRDWVEYAIKIIARGKQKYGNSLFKIEKGFSLSKVQVPYDLLLGDSLENAKNLKTVRINGTGEVVTKGWSALDIGPITAKVFSRIIKQSKTVFWNGPMGVFEDERFESGSRRVAKAMEVVNGMTIIAGGDTIEAAEKFCNTKKITHLSLAGGASLEFLAGKKLPVLEFLRVD